MIPYGPRPCTQDVFVVHLDSSSPSPPLTKKFTRRPPHLPSLPLLLPLRDVLPSITPSYSFPALMGGSDESGSPTKPLLSNPPPLYPSLDDPPKIDQPESEHTHYFQISYNYGPRSFKDLPFLIIFLLFVLCTFVFGIFAICNRNKSYSALSSYVYDSDSASCVEDSLGVSSSNWVFLFSSSSSQIVKGLIWTLVITLILSVPICFVLLILLKHYAKQIVYVFLPFFVVVPVFFNVYWFVACTVSSSCSEDFPLPYRILVLVFVFIVIGVIVWIFVINWRRIELTVTIIRVASDALTKNLGLFGVVPCMSLALVVYCAPIIVFLVFARMNGKIAPKESSGEYSCIWKQDSWVGAYYALAILTLLWSISTMLEGQVYVISGTISQWYFSKEDTPPRRSIRNSLGNAFGPSSGTVCLSGLLISAVRVVRALVDSAGREEIPGIVNLVLRCCVNVFLSAIDFLNKFTIIFAAITGDSYCSSARMTHELLRRNLLSAAFVETISTRLLAGIVFVVSSIYAIVACAILKAVSNIGVDSYFVAILAWLLLMVVLGFFVHVLDNVIDTVYVCYAIDKDKGDVCKPDVHEVYVSLPITRNHRPSLLHSSVNV